MIRRYITLLVFAMWMGGFTFYALIVIPTATRVLDSARRVGFITEQVTFWLNLIGLVAMAVFYWNAARIWNWQTRIRRILLIIALGAMVLSHIGLFVVHPMIDRLLDPQARQIHGYDSFLTLHTTYLCFATAEWTAVLIYIWLSLASWRQEDYQKGSGSGIPADPGNGTDSASRRSVGSMTRQPEVSP